jgi:hypothetical protein
LFLIISEILISDLMEHASISLFGEKFRDLGPARRLIITKLWRAGLITHGAPWYFKYSPQKSAAPS